MGCDIHLMVEKRVEGKWQIAPWDGTTTPCYCTWKWVDKVRVPCEPDADCYSCGPVKDHHYDEDDDGPRRPATRPGERMVDWYDGRNYDLFAILANVRNGYGFAGCDTGDGFKPIVEPRGVPDDATEEYKRFVKRWDAGGHSHSWLTLAELLAFDWEQTTRRRGTVVPGQYIAWREKGAPDGWSGGVSGPGVKYISNEEMANRISRGEFTAEDLREMHFPRCGYYTVVEWTWTYRRCCEHFWRETMPRLERVGHPDNVRLCFFFDN